MGRPAAFERLSTSDRIREILLERILDATYEPGDRIVEMEVAEELGTSQAPVREALRELQGLRLVTVKAYRGACVREVTEKEMREAFEVRASLEEFAARRAGSGLRDRLDDLRAALEGMMQAARDRDPNRFAKHDLSFHRAIVDAADHGVLLRTWESLGVEVRIRMLLERSDVDLEPVGEAHAPILEAIDQGDIDEVGRLLLGHPKSTYEIAGLEWTP